MQTPKTKKQKIAGTYDGLPVGTPRSSMRTSLVPVDPFECARKVAAINAMQYQMMPQAINCFWPQQQCSVNNPWIGTNTPPMLTGISPWVPPLPSPFLMGITCDGIPVKKRSKNIAKTLTSPSSSGVLENPSVTKLPEIQKNEKIDDGRSLVSELSIGTLENSCSILSSDTCENMDSVNNDPFLCENFDLFSSDFDAFLNQLSSYSDDFLESDDNFLTSTKFQVSFLEPHVRIPRKKRTYRRVTKNLSKKRLRSFYTLFNVER